MANYTRPDATFPAIAESGVRTAMSPSDVGKGWSTTSQTRPPAADFNARDFYTSSAMKYLLRLGVAEYSPTENYQGLGLCIGSNGSVYWNLIACNGVDPVTDLTGKWEKTAIRRADCAELIGNVTGGVIPETLNLLKGNNLGSAADSGIATDGTTTTFPTSIVAAGAVTAPYYVATGQIGGFNEATAFVDVLSGTTGRLFAKSNNAALGAILLAGYSSNADGRFTNYLQCSEPTHGAAQVYASVPVFATANGALRLIDRRNSLVPIPGTASIGVDGTSLVLNPTASGGIYLNWEQGTGGVYFGSGVGGNQVAHVDNGGNLSLNGGVFAGQNGFSMACPTNNFKISSDGGSSFIDGGCGYRLLINAHAAGAGYAGETQVFGNFRVSGSSTLILFSPTGQPAASSFPTIRVDSVNNLILNAGSGDLYLNYDQGGIINFCNSRTITGHIDGSGNAFFNGAMYVAGVSATWLRCNGQSGGLDIQSDGATQHFTLTDDGGTSFIDGAHGGRLYINASNAGGIVRVSSLVDAAALQVASAAPAGKVLMGNGSSYVPVDPLPPPSGVPSDVTSQRAFMAQYQNNTGRAIFVAVSATVGSGGGLMRAYVGGGSASMLVAGQDRTNAGGNGNLGGGANYAFMVSFMVPAGWYYEVQEAAGNTGNPLLMTWIEYQL